MTDTTAEDDLAARLVATDDGAFHKIVNDDTRGKLDTKIAQALRSPTVARRWRVALMSMLLSVEGQLAAKTAENNSQVQRLYSQREANKAMAVQSDFERWKAGSLRFKNGLDTRLLEARELARSMDEPVILDHVTAERNAALFRVMELEQAIEAHQRDFPAVDSPSEADETLWAVVARKPNHFEEKLGDF